MSLKNRLMLVNLIINFKKLQFFNVIFNITKLNIDFY